MKTCDNYRANAPHRLDLSGALEPSHDQRTEEIDTVPAPLKSWRDIERAMDRAHDLRALHCAALLRAAFRRLRLGLFRHRSRIASRRVHVAGRVALVTCAVALAPVTIFPGAVFAEGARTMSGSTANEVIIADEAVLAELGLALEDIHARKDVELLWRAVREVVLPGRVSEATQQRILRRVWAIDLDIARGSPLASETH